MSNYTEEQFWKLYKQLPEELQQALFSIESTNYVYNLCRENKIEKISDVIKYIGDVLIGGLAPENFSEVLEKELNIETEKAKKISREISRFVFLPVRPALERLYGSKSASNTTEKKSTSEKDIYREPIEP
jgi:hypothetical protein